MGQALFSNKTCLMGQCVRFVLTNLCFPTTLISTPTSGMFSYVSVIQDTMFLHHQSWINCTSLRMHTFLLFNFNIRSPCCLLVFWSSHFPNFNLITIFFLIPLRQGCACQHQYYAVHISHALKTTTAAHAFSACVYLSLTHDNPPPLHTRWCRLDGCHLS